MPDSLKQKCKQNQKDGVTNQIPFDVRKVRFIQVKMSHEHLDLLRLINEFQLRASQSYV